MDDRQHRRTSGKLGRQSTPAGFRWGSRIRAHGFVLALVVAGLMLLAACGTPPPTETPDSAPSDAPTVVSAAGTDTPQAPTATSPADTATLIPTSTPLNPPATETPLPADTPLPANTPVPPTATPPPPTNTPVPPTATPLPPTATVSSPTATVAPPTAAPPPPPQFPWRGQVAGTFSNCGLTRLMGLTLDRNGGLAGNVWVHFWADGWDGGWTPSSWAANEGYPGLDDSSNWDGVLDTYAKAGTWHVCVVPGQGSWDCISKTVTAQTVSEPCTPDSGGVQIVRFVFQQN